MVFSASYWIDKLGLTRHVEGGSFKEVYRSPLIIPTSFEETDHRRNASTSIYFLLEAGQFSAFHRILSDEIWHFYSGNCLVIYEIEAEGVLTEHRLGNRPDKGEEFQCVIRAGNWFASRIEEGGTFALCGCTVAPGFDFRDFELADRIKLSALFPQHEKLISELTYENNRDHS